MSNHPLTPMPELLPQLKRLCLSGMLETLPQRNREAIEHKLSYTEFFGLLLQDEITRRDNKRYAMRVKRAGFQGEKTIENFNFDFNPQINPVLIKELATCQFVLERAPVLIVGPCGTGKSHLAQAIGHCVTRAGIDVLFTTQTQLLKSLRVAKAAGGYDKRLTALAKIPLLIIDDFGLKPLHSPQDEDMHDLITHRYERSSTLVTSNLDFSEWIDAFDNKLLGAATIDRLRDRAYSVVLQGQSYRRARPQPEPLTEVMPTTTNADTAAPTMHGHAKQAQ